MEIKKEFKHFATKKSTLKEDRSVGNEQKAIGYIENSTMTEVSPSLLVIKVNGLNPPIKRQRSAEWVKIHDPIKCPLQEIHLWPQNTVERKILHANNQKRAVVVILISSKIEFWIAKGCKRQRRMVYINRSLNMARRYDNDKHLHT